MPVNWPYGCVHAALPIKRFSELRRQIRRYQANFKEYIRSRDAEDPNSLHLLFEEENTARWWKTMSHQAIDFNTVPRFQEKDLNISETLQLAIWDIGHSDCQMTCSDSENP